MRTTTRHRVPGDGRRRLDRRLHGRRRCACWPALDVPRRALIGPWGHVDPVHGNPGPSVGHPGRVRALVGPLAQGHRERHRRGAGAGRLHAGLRAARAPTSRSGPGAGSPSRRGRRRASRRARAAARRARSGSAPERPGPLAPSARCSPSACRRRAWCADGKSADLPLDQRAEDGARSCSTPRRWTSALEILGFVEARLVLASDQPLALVSARLCELRADGASLLVTRGQLNLCHRALARATRAARAREELRGHA